MKKSIFIFFAVALSISLSSCKEKSKSEDSSAGSQNQAGTSESARTEEPPEQEIIFEDKNSSDEDALKYYQYYLDALEEGFVRQIPEYSEFEKDVRKYDIDFSNLPKEYEDFFYNYEGNYTRNYSFTTENLNRNLYEVRPESIVNGIVNYRIGKRNESVHFDDRNNVFYYGNGFESSKIDDISNFRIGGKRASWPASESNPIKEAYNKKYEEQSNYSQDFDEAKLKNLLSSFFESLEHENYATLYNECIDNESFFDTGNSEFKRYAKKDFQEYFPVWHNSFLYKSGMKFCTNLYYSEDYDLISKNFGGCILVEGIFPTDTYNYFSFVVTEKDGRYVISGFRDRLDGE